MSESQLHRSGYLNIHVSTTHRLPFGNVSVAAWPNYSYNRGIERRRYLNGATRVSITHGNATANGRAMLNPVNGGVATRQTEILD